MLQYKVSLKQAKDIFVEMDLYYPGSLNFFNTEFYSPKELGLCKAFKPWEMYQDFVHQDQLGTEYLESLLLEEALLWLDEDLSLILTPSRRKEGAYERLGIFHKRWIKGGMVLNEDFKMPKTVQRSRITLV